MKPYKVFEEKIRKLYYKDAASAIGNINRAAREGKISEGMRNRLNKLAQKRYKEWEGFMSKAKAQPGRQAFDEKTYMNELKRKFGSMSRALTALKESERSSHPPLKAYVWDMGADDIGLIVTLASTEKEAKAKAKMAIGESYHGLLRRKNLHIVDGDKVLLATLEVKLGQPKVIT